MGNDVKIDNAALVLQGGGARGAFTAGVLDVFMENHLVFPYVIGTSAGALNAVILKFASIGVNLTKLESRPIPGTDFEFRFIFDFEASPCDTAILALLSELAQDPEIEHFAFLGAYAEK